VSLVFFFIFYVGILGASGRMASSICQVERRLYDQDFDRQPFHLVLGTSSTIIW